MNNLQVVNLKKRLIYARRAALFILGVLLSLPTFAAVSTMGSTYLAQVAVVHICVPSIP